MKKLILVILFSISSLLASEKDSSREYTQEEIESLSGVGSISQQCSGTSIKRSLFDKGNSLEGVKVQDQDGLQTCYANTASLIIKSHNPKKPVPSYLDLASYNKFDPSKKYDFDRGLTCDLINTIKEQDIPLCSNSILENRPVQVQDEILYSLYNLINGKDNNEEKINQQSKDSLLQNISQFESFLADNPMPKRESCDVAEGLNFKKYIYNHLSALLSSYAYENVEEQVETQSCAYIVHKRMRELGIDQSKKEISDDDYQDFSFNPNFIKNINEDISSRLKSTRMPSGKTYYNTIVSMLDSEKTSSGIRGKFIDYGPSQVKAYHRIVNIIGKEVQGSLNLAYSSLKKEGSQKLVSCLDQYEKSATFNPAAFLNSINSSCHSQINLWERYHRQSYASCSDEVKKMFYTLRSLTQLGADLNKVKDFLSKKGDKRQLRSLMESLCEKKIKYDFPSKKCEYFQVLEGLSLVKEAQDFIPYQKWMEILDDYVKTHPESKIDFEKLVAFFKEKTSSKDFFNGISKTLFYDFGTQVNKSLSDVTDDLDIKGFKSILKKTVQNLIKKKNKGANKIVDSIKAGHAVGVSTCASMFTGLKKKKYTNCQNHAVTATGVQCVNGKLKVQITNSWGIGCEDNKEQQSLFSCEKDVDGLTNGKAWVDYDYLADQGFRLRSF
ncbi:MAG: hypothetical protein N4A33_02530 [Bacteriovoracaceae bacterium]|nr:hypothetical protein [Bacteriovoracaceae bacterium]